MNIKSSLIILFFFLITGHAFAIDPVYEGSNGIRERVFATNCLACHSSELTGPDRNGAPPEINFDTYEATEPTAERAMVRAVEEMSMPPAGNGIPQLNDEQKSAMLAWQSAGFPQSLTATTSVAPNSSFDGTRLRIPVVIVGTQRFNAVLRLTLLESSPTGFGFVLESAVLTTERSRAPATANIQTGRVLVPSVTVIRNGVNTGTVDIQLTLVPGTRPMLFSLDTRLVVPANASYSFNSRVLNLPVVIIGNQRFRANLRLIPLEGSPTRIGFVLQSAVLTTATSDNAAIFNTSTRRLVLPYVEMIRNDTVESVVRAEMQLVGTNPTVLSLLRFATIPRAQ